jgi:hypothetical protein
MEAQSRNLLKLLHLCMFYRLNLLLKQIIVASKNLIKFNHKWHHVNMNLLVYYRLLQCYFRTIFFQSPYHFHIKWPTFKSLAKKYVSTLNQFLKYFGFSLVEPESTFEKPSDIYKFNPPY